jgi:signal transduction histidine kinase
VVTHGSCDRRFAQSIEANAYFFVAEALTNAAKYARASRVDVELRVCGTELIVDVADGIGGATLVGLGTGLSGLQDRVSALDGRSRLDSRRAAALACTRSRCHSRPNAVPASQAGHKHHHVMVLRHGQVMA